MLNKEKEIRILTILFKAKVKSRSVNKTRYKIAVLCTFIEQ